jgi:hypothetical protein
MFQRYSTTSLLARFFILTTDKVFSQSTGMLLFGCATVLRAECSTVS